MSRRNIVMVTFDSLRADHCGFMGYERNTTPNLDKMAEEGLYFENAIAPGPGTPVSIFGSFTGELSPVDIKEMRPKPWENAIRRRETIAQLLSEKGYTTGAFTPNPFASSFFGFDKGFDYFQDFMSDKDGPLDKLYRGILDRFTKTGRTGLTSIIRGVRNILKEEEIFKPWEDYYDDILDWIDNADEPFFLWVLLLDTHHPYLGPPHFQENENQLPLYFFSWNGPKNDWKLELDQDKQKKILDAYDDSILYADEFLGELRSDLAEYDPVFIVHSDHGEGLGDHGFYAHPPSLYEEIIRVPLVIWNFGLNESKKDPFSTVNLSRFIESIVGNKDNTANGNGLDRKWAISEVLSEGNRKFGVRLGNWKYIKEKNGEEQLFNLDQDPKERNNVVKEYNNLVEELKEIIRLHTRNRELERI
ncbi:hypothetical protein AKJ65_03680 [candidate division MSBL1 archaeon SCGC-AAA259E19]|uniref:Sulfatase N-terminal domain-containing protein n=1 Tax=candidate division MSBL1 archaeon SCGC-AAA259E19 TaxID=1698264 RepID=A0A133UKH2_9EURY|nr:hypothetical protein AKJ65_03680 [candidate division MSBL1 archaeon SCGC-AAA259E19]